MDFPQTQYLLPMMLKILIFTFISKQRSLKKGPLNKNYYLLEFPIQGNQVNREELQIS